MTGPQQDTVNDLGRSFDAAFAQWIETNRADLDKLQMSPGSVVGITAGLKQSLITILSQQTGTAAPIAAPPAVPIPIVTAPAIVLAPKK